MRYIASAILVDQGVDVSESRKQLIRRFAAASVLAEQLESKLANGQQIDIAETRTAVLNADATCDALGH
jgi:hypothetical protein